MPFIEIKLFRVYIYQHNFDYFMMHISYVRPKYEGRISVRERRLTSLTRMFQETVDQTVVS